MWSGGPVWVLIPWSFLFVLFPTSNQRASAVDFTLLFTSLFFIPCQGLIAVGIMATCFSKTATERETLARIGVTLLYNHVQVITYIPSPLLHPLVRSKSQVLFTLKGRGLTKSMNTRRHDEGVLLTIPGLSDHFGKPAVCKVTQDLDCWRLVISGRVRQGKGTEVWQKPWQTLCRPSPCYNFLRWLLWRGQDLQIFVNSGSRWQGHRGQT